MEKQKICGKIGFFKKKLVELSRLYLVKTAKYLRFYYRLIIWLTINKLRNITWRTKRHLNTIRPLFFVLFSIIIGLFVSAYGGVDFSKEIISNFLFTVAAMSGGMMAITFTISIFLIQNASNLYSSQYFENYVHDWKEKLIYFFVVLITIILYVTGTYIGSEPYLNQQSTSIVLLLSIFSIGCIFACIDWQYTNVLKKINLSNPIYFLEKRGILFIKRLQRDAKRIADIIKASDETMSQESATAIAYNKFFQPDISNIDRQLENLIEISLRLIDKQEVDATKKCLRAIKNILKGVIYARKDSSLIIPSGHAFLALETDSQSFLSNNYERLNKVGEKLIKEDKDEIALFIIEIYSELSRDIVSLNFIGQKNENPSLDLLTSYLSFLVDTGKKFNNAEVVYRSASAFKDIAIISAINGFGVTLRGTQDKLLKVATYALSQKQMVTVERCLIAFLNIIIATFNSEKIVRRHHYDDSLKNISTITSYIMSLIKTNVLPNDLGSRVILCKGYDEFYMVLNKLMLRYSEISDDNLKRTYRNDIVNFFNEINNSIRKLSGEIKNADSVLIDSVGLVIFNINELIIQLIKDDEFADIKAELTSNLNWNIYLPGWFSNNAVKFDASSNQFNTLTDSIAKSGILIADKLKNKELVADCIDSIYSIAKDGLEKATSRNGYDEPRIMEKACYLGILALKNNWEDVVDVLKVKIIEYESIYFNKYLSNTDHLPKNIDVMNHNVIGLPHHDQLFRELLRWRRECEGLTPHMALIQNDSASMMLAYIERVDIDKFLYRIWSVLLDNSKFKPNQD